MKRYNLICLIILGIFVIVPCVYGEISVSTGVRYDLFTANDVPETIGYEVTFPLGVTYIWKQVLTFSLNTAFSNANVYPGNGDHVQIVSLTDTRLAASYGLPNLPVGLTFGVELNLPTGKERLSSTQKIAEAGDDHDLFEVDDFGEGLNIGVNVGLAKEFGSLSASVNGKYQFNGEYDPTTDWTEDDLDPGDQFQLTALFNWKASSHVKLETSVGYSYFTADQTNGHETFQEGAKLAFGVNLRILAQVYRPVRIVAGVQMAGQAKNKEANLAGTLQTEPENSNSRRVFGLVDVLYEYSPRFAFRVIGDMRYYAESPRQDVVPYKGQRLRYAVGPGWIYAPNKRLLVNGLVKYFILKHDKDIGLLQDTTYQGVNVSIDLIYNF
jgi:hypothetical protein